MSRAQEEEYLEQLWYQKENSVDTLEELESATQGSFRVEVLNRLCEQGLVVFSDGGRQRVSLTALGEENARRVIRCHRLAERLLYDVLGVSGEEVESGACEFEHIIAPDLVDSICILLGHPRECPHGRPIPEGECCRKEVRLVESSAIPLTELMVSDVASVAFVRCDRDEQMHRLDALCIRPGVKIKLHQVFPTFVVECEGAMIAFEERIAASIYVWLQRSGTGKVALVRRRS